MQYASADRGRPLTSGVMPRHVLIVGGLLLAVLLERGAYYGSTGVLSLWMVSDLGMSAPDTFGLYSLMGWAIGLGPLLGGAIAIGIGPRITAALGALFSALGYGALLVTEAGPPFAAVILIALGTGLFRPSLFVALAQELGHPHNNARSGAFLLAYFGVSASAMVATSSTFAIGRNSGYEIVFALSAAVCVIVFLLVAGVMTVHRTVGEKPEPRAFGARAELGAAVLLALMVPYYVGTSAFGSIQFEAALDMQESGGSMLVLNPAVVTLVTLMAAIIFFVAASRKARPITLYAAGGGLVVFALGLGVGGLSEPGSGLDTALLLGIILTAIGEAVAGGLVLARVAGDCHPRRGTLVFAVFLVATSRVSQLGSLAEEPSTMRIVVGACAVLTLIAGVVMIALAAPMQRVLYTPRDEAGDVADEAVGDAP